MWVSHTAVDFEYPYSSENYAEINKAITELRSLLKLKTIHGLMPSIY